MASNNNNKQQTTFGLLELLSAANNNNNNNMIIMQVEDEVECGCGCPAHLQADCSGPGHAFNKEACQCECRDQAARRRSEYKIM